MTDFDTQVLAEAMRLRELGFACHWLHPKQKRPKGKDWQEGPPLTAALLGSAFVHRDNLGVRLGEPSHLVDGSYLHVIDADIRVPEARDEALAALGELLGDTSALPMVRSGSGGESFHLYFTTDKPFRSKKLAQSDEKFRGPEGSWHRHWELELFGTGKQVVLPPSIHPSGKPYRWEREFEEFTLRFGDDYAISSDLLASLAVPDDTHYEYESASPLTFKDGQLERILDDIPVSDLHYDDWLRLGQALHHQMGGTQEGFQMWLKHTERSEKHDGKASTVRTMRMKWRSFGKYRGRPVTMATVVAWAQEARLDALAEEFDDLEDLDDGEEAGDGFDDIFDTDTDSDGSAGNSDGGSSDSDPFDTSESKLHWTSLLEITEKNAYKSTLHNLTLIIANDPRTRGIIRRNLLSDTIVQYGTPKIVNKKRKNAPKEAVQLDSPIWQMRDNINGDPWSDDKDVAVRAILEAPVTQRGYGIKVSDRDLDGAIRQSANRNAFHPVRDYLTSLTWDGVPRMEALFIDYLGTPDNAYYRQIARLTLIAGVTRVFEPGHKWDHAPIIEGLQGRGKSTFIKILGKNWAAELDGDFADDRAMIEKMSGKWILEMPELSGFTKAEVNHIKAFMSREQDRARLAYDRRVTDFRRQCIFIGTTNDKRYLKDETGGRRFWPVECSFGMDREVDTDRLEREVDQLWAEAYAAYVEMRRVQPRGTLPLYLRDKEASRIAASLQESRRVNNQSDTLVGIVEEWLDSPSHSGDIDEETSPKRNKTCSLEIWVDCLGKDRANFPNADRIAINKVLDRLSGWKEVGQRRFSAKIGRQIAYIRVGSAEDRG